MIGGFWSVASNWKENAAPANGDSVVFDTTSNTPAKDDIQGLKIANFTVTNAYTSTIRLDNGLEADGSVTIQAGTLSATNISIFTVPNLASVFTWEGGTIDASARVILGGGTAIPTLILDGAGGVTLNGTFDSYAQASLNNGDITMGNNAQFTNELGATFNIKVDHSFLVPVGSAGIFNTGVFEKTGAGQTSKIDPLFINNPGALLLAQKGTLSFTNGATQKGGATELYGGNISSPTFGFDLQGGLFQGVNTFTGDLDQKGGTVIPGLGSTTGNGIAGTLTITGNYTEGTSGTLRINTDTTTVSQLAVQGKLDMSGALLVWRNLQFQPGLGSSFAFLPWGTINPNDSFTVTYVNNVWGPVPGLGFTVVQSITKNEFDLVVVRH